MLKRRRPSHPRRPSRRGLGGTPAEHRAVARMLLKDVGPIRAVVLEEIAAKNCPEAVRQYGRLAAQVGAAAQQAGEAHDATLDTVIGAMPSIRSTRNQLIRACVRSRK